MFKSCTVYFLIGVLVVLGSVALPVTEEPLAFEINGIKHYETRTVLDHIVTLTDKGDQFIVTLDYRRGIALINNLKTGVCYFSDLENFPLREDDHVPIYVVEGDKEIPRKDLVTILLTPVGRIPYDYVRLTNDIKIAEQCISKQSFWLEEKYGERNGRALKCDKDCDWPICVDVDLDIDVDIDWSKLPW